MSEVFVHQLEIAVDDDTAVAVAVRRPPSTSTPTETGGRGDRTRAPRATLPTANDQSGTSSLRCKDVHARPTPRQAY